MVGPNQRFVLTLAAAWGLVLAGCDDQCQLNTDCPTEASCVAGACLVPDASVEDAEPADASDGAAGLADVRIPLEDAARRDASESDAGRPDARSPSPDSARGDQGLADAGLVPDAPEAGAADGEVTAGAKDLTGTYALTRTVVLTDQPGVSAGDETHLIANLTRLAPESSRYRLDLLSAVGTPEGSEPEIDLRSPEGSSAYQLSLSAPLAAPSPACTGSVEQFERGEIVNDGERLSLVGELTVRRVFEGVDCDEPSRRTVIETRWNRLPAPRVPEPAPDAAVADALAGPELPPAIPGLSFRFDAGPATDATPGADAR